MPVLAKPDTIAGPLTARDLEAARKHSTGNVWLMPRRFEPGQVAADDDIEAGWIGSRFIDTVPVQPAEACTEIGADAVESMWRHRRTEATVRWGLSLAAVLAVVGYVVRAVWPLA